MSSTIRAGISGALGMTFVGGSVAVSGVLADAPLHTAQALRYAVACALLVAWARMTGRTLHRPRGTEWLWLIGVAVSGLVVFNVALVHGSRHAEPAVLAVGVACVPVALAAIGPLLEGRGPRARVLAAAVVVSAGAVVVEGFGRADAVGAGVGGHGVRVRGRFHAARRPGARQPRAGRGSVHTTWIAAAMFAVLALRIEGVSAATTFDLGDVLAIGYLAVGVTAVAFILWYSCVQSLGSRARRAADRHRADRGRCHRRAGHRRDARTAVWAGMALIAVGLAVGLRAEPIETSARRSDSTTFQSDART